ncbi:hypothetical protein E2493_09730 [Sphingomonas parva]|uniref:Uncharacterized protein n=1 Tax=Sphingomonas parva TaxID=2555898 RepID=A0A4Y8ZSE8_9SPHN|nr:hypothetical protein [Sphingomonas parva]TFI58407.1 hypothetical protein E2493_09730 [Sphingomonas parva]
MKLIELVEQAAGWEDDDTTIYVSKPWTIDAEATLVCPAPDETSPIERDGRVYHYFLETFIAREFQKDYAASVEGRDASTLQVCEWLISYAENDA